MQLYPNQCQIKCHHLFLLQQILDQIRIPQFGEQPKEWYIIDLPRILIKNMRKILIVGRTISHIVHNKVIIIIIVILLEFVPIKKQVLKDLLIQIIPEHLYHKQIDIPILMPILKCNPKILCSAKMAHQLRTFPDKLTCHTMDQLLWVNVLPFKHHHMKFP